MRTETSDTDHISRTFDDLGRLSRLDFLLSGKSATVEYLDNPVVEAAVACTDPRRITWSDGYVYVTWKDRDGALHSVETGRP